MMQDDTTMAEALAENGLLELFAIIAGSGGANGEGVDATRLAWFDPETRMFFTRNEGKPIGGNADESARTILPIVEAHPELSSVPFGGGEDQVSDQRLIDLTEPGVGRLVHRGRSWDPEEGSRAPEYINQYCHPWCAIVAEEYPRYTHMYGFVVYWGNEHPTVLSHSVLWDTHESVIVDGNPNVDFDEGVTYLMLSAPRDMLRTEYRGRKNLTALRIFYAGLPRA